MAIGKISPVRGNADQYPSHSLKGSLLREKLTRAPKTLRRLYPYKNIDGTYRTGLDENAAYIKQLPQEEQEQERVKVRGFLQMAQEAYGPNIDFSPRSPFWSKMVQRWGEEDVAPVADLHDRDNIFDLSHPQQLITYAYLRVHPRIAPSGQALMTGAYSRAEYYVNDYDVETAVAFKIKSKITKALAKLDKLSPTKRKMVARQLGISVSDATSEEAVFVLLMNYIEASNTAKTSGNVDLFSNFVDMKDENLLIRDTVEMAFQFNVYRKFKNAIYRGDEKVAATKEMLIEMLTDPKNQEDLLTVQEEIKLKKSVKS